MVATKRQELWCSLQEISSEERIQDLRTATELTLLSHCESFLDHTSQ